jgi:hypothetical protein
LLAHLPASAIPFRLLGSDPAIAGGRSVILSKWRRSRDSLFRVNSLPDPVSRCQEMLPDPCLTPSSIGPKWDHSGILRRRICDHGRRTMELPTSAISVRLAVIPSWLGCLQHKRLRH